MNPSLLALGLLLYNLSKVLSSFRLNLCFRDYDVVLSTKDNLVLYYIGMFYNLFLPGGIGGDAYKVWLLRQNGFGETNHLVRSVLFDRISGMMMLGVLGLTLGWVSFPDIPYRYLLVFAAVITIPGFYILTLLFAKQLLKSFFKTTILSLGVQGLQIFCALAILTGLGVEDHILVYVTVFLISSLVSVLPISVGGIGIRELVFVAAAGFWPISQDVSVAFSLLFFLLTALSSLPGGILSTRWAKK